MSNVMKVLDEARYCLGLDNRDAIASQLLEAQLEIARLLAASPAHDGEVVAWRYSIKREDDSVSVRLSAIEYGKGLSPFGKRGTDYSEEYEVTCEPLYTAPPRVAVDIECIAKGLAESNGWDDWDTAKDVTDTPAGNEPEEEREWYRDMVKFVVSALEQSK